MKDAGYLIAFEGLDQSGKQTQTERLLTALKARGLVVRFLSFPDYDTAIGAEIGRALRGDHHYPADVMQLLYVANRGEHREAVERWLAAGDIVVCDRYLASSVAYGEAHGLDPQWLTTIQQRLPPPALTILLDIAPEASLARKQINRDRFEQDLALLQRVRESYLRQASAATWQRIDGAQDRDAVAREVMATAQARLALR